MQLTRRKSKQLRYTDFQKFLAANVLIGASEDGYKFLRNILPLPSKETVMRVLRKLKTLPGIAKKNAQMIKIKVNPQNEGDKFVFLLFDEMSIRKGLAYDIPSDKIFGYQDNGSNRIQSFASSAFTVMARGVVKKFKYPLGYFFTDRVMKSNEIKEVIISSISAMEEEGFIVLGLTTDQGSNFESTFKQLGATVDSPKIEVNGKKYFAYRDPPHLIKSARNYLEKKPVLVPGCLGTAKWDHIKTVYAEDLQSSLRLLPKLSEQHLFDLRFATKMKVRKK